MHSSASHLGRHKSQVAPFARYVTRYEVRAGDKWATKSFAGYTWDQPGQEVNIHCAAKARLLNHRFIVAPLDMEARAKGEGGGAGFA